MGPGRSFCLDVPRCPHETRGSACLSNEVCGGPGGDWGGAPPKAQLQAEMALGISLGLPVCQSEPVSHALGRGANQLKRGTMPSRQMGTGELPGASSQRPLCVSGAQPLAGAVPARTKCL